LSNPENNFYEQLAQYLKLQHPDVLFHFDLSGVNNGSLYTRSLYSRLNGRGWPDLFIARAAMMPGTTNVYYGLFLELKVDGTRLKKADGSWASPHIAQQANVLNLLASEGFVAQFAVGLDEAIALIDSYLAGRLRAAP
jgi:hypothetical protein